MLAACDTSNAYWYWLIGKPAFSDSRPGAFCVTMNDCCAAEMHLPRTAPFGRYFELTVRHSWVSWPNGVYSSSYTRSRWKLVLSNPVNLKAPLPTRGTVAIWTQDQSSVPSCRLFEKLVLTSP